MVPTVHTVSVRLHLCYITKHVVSIVTTMHICSRACWLLTSLLTMFKYAMACDSLSGVKCLACASMLWSVYSYRLPKLQNQNL